ncbi:MAG: hypothetical protein GEV05_26740 [Betaproteobacteria bacterium]|nr:hypothetical protein [Betaproteobacteria bacterium]
MPGYEGITWTAVGAPARTPRAAIERLNREFNAALQLPDIRERLAFGGSVVIGGTPEQFRDYLKAEPIQGRNAVPRIRLALASPAA